MRGGKEGEKGTKLLLPSVATRRRRRQSVCRRYFLLTTCKTNNNWSGLCIPAPRFVSHFLKSTKKKKLSLLQESEKLESVNADLKAQIEELKQQKQQLVYMLNLHRPTCIVRAQNGQTPEDERNLFIQHIKESTLQLQNLTSATTSSSSTSTSTVAPLDGGLLTLDHIQCPSHLWVTRC